MRTALIAIVVCAVPVRALADTSAVWDGIYERESAGGTELCPKSSDRVSITGGKLSIVWNVIIGDKPIPVGRIEGTVRAGGDVVPAVKLADPLPAAVVEMMRRAGDLDELKSIGNGIKLSLRTLSSSRELRLGGGMCYASWTASPAPPSAPAASAPTQPPSEPEVADEPPEAAQEPAPAPAPGKRAKAGSKGKPAASKAAVVKPTKPPPPAPKAAKATPVKAAPKPPAPVRDGGRSGSSTPSPRPAKEEPRKRGAANGATCGYASDCESNNCEYRKCASKDTSSKKLGNGFACNYSSDCASGNCEYRKCASNDSSRKALGTGADCVYGSDCVSGSCNYHKCVDD